MNIFAQPFEGAVSLLCESSFVLFFEGTVSLSVLPKNNV